MRVVSQQQHLPVGALQLMKLVDTNNITVQVIITLINMLHSDSESGSSEGNKQEGEEGSTSSEKSIPKKVLKKVRH